MSSPLKMTAIKEPGLLAFLWRWFRRLFRRKQSPKLLDKMVDEETMPFSPPAVVSRRVVMGENPLLAPARPRLKPSMVMTAKLSMVGEEVEQTAKVSTPPEPISLPLPVSVISPKGKSRLSTMLESPTTETPLQVSRDAVTQQFHSPHLVNPTTGSKIVPPTARNRSNVIVPLRSVALLFPEDLVPKTLVQPRIQDDLELMELVEEFNAKHGDSEP